MLDEELRDIAEAQVERWRRLQELGVSELSLGLERALRPDEIRRVLMKDRPLLDARHRLEALQPDAHALREEAASAGTLEASSLDLAFRRLYPSLDVGVYCGSHAMGKPSMALLPAIEEHLGQLLVHGIGAWLDGGWIDVMEGFRHRIAELCGADLNRGDVAAFRNFSDGLSCLLNSGLSGRLVTTAGHFTSAHYVHQHWAARTGSQVVTVATEADGSVGPDAIIDALTPDTTVISLSHAFWRTGYLQDVYALTEAVMDICPEAAFLLDVYQTAGTVPLSVGRLPMCTAILGGGGKQLRAGTGSGYAWVANALLERLEPDRLGWWAHRSPLAFSQDFEPASGAARWQTGVPDVTPLVSLLTELEVFSTSGDGSLRTAVERARRVTVEQTRLAIEVAEEHGLNVASPVDDERRAAFVSIRLVDGDQLVEELASEGVVCDWRADAPGNRTGVVRMSGNAAGFGYELAYAVERLAALVDER